MLNVDLTGILNHIVVIMTVNANQGKASVTANFAKASTSTEQSLPGYIELAGRLRNGHPFGHQAQHRAFPRIRACSTNGRLLDE